MFKGFYDFIRNLNVVKNFIGTYQLNDYLKALTENEQINFWKASLDEFRLILVFTYPNHTYRP